MLADGKSMFPGIGGRLEHIRNGRVIANLSDDNPYSYDNPHVYRWAQLSSLQL